MSVFDWFTAPRPHPMSPPAGPVGAWCERAELEHAEKFTGEALVSRFPEGKTQYYRDLAGWYFELLEEMHRACPAAVQPFRERYEGWPAAMLGPIAGEIATYPIPVLRGCECESCTRRRALAVEDIGKLDYEIGVLTAKRDQLQRRLSGEPPP